MSAWAICDDCRGYGMDFYSVMAHGQPVACKQCKGDGVVRNRDAKGRYTGNPKDDHRNDASTGA